MDWCEAPCPEATTEILKDELLESERLREREARPEPFLSIFVTENTLTHPVYPTESDHV